MLCSSPRITNLQVPHLCGVLLEVRLSIRRLLQPIRLMAWHTSSSVVDLHVPHKVTTLGCLRGDRAHCGKFFFHWGGWRHWIMLKILERGLQLSRGDVRGD